MHSFIYLSAYQVVICKECKYGVVTEEIYAYLTNKNHPDVSTNERRRITDEICRIPGIIKTEQQLKEFRFPKASSLAIPELKAPRVDGMKCRSCLYISCNRSDIQKHCKEKHSWKNPQKQGRPRSTGSQFKPEKPWISKVHCQRFFGQGFGSGWFEVEKAEVVEGPAENVLNRVKRITTAGLERVQKRRREQIKAGDQSKEPNLWIKRVAWDEHLANKNRAALLASIQAADPVKERVLFGICNSFQRVIEDAQKTAVRKKAMQAALFEVNRKERGKKARKPFDSQMDPETFQRYTSVWIQILGYLHRTHEWTEHDRPAYRLTSRQEDARKQLTVAVQALIGLQDARGEDEAASKDEEAKQAEVDQSCLRLCMEMLDHQLTQSEYDSVVLSAMAVMGMREDEGWVGAENYTWRYSAFIKLARMLVVRLAYVQREKRIAEMMETGMAEQTARERTEGMYDRVHRYVDRYMVIVHDQTKPTPMDWIYESRSYGMKIWYTTAAEGTVDWVDDQTIQYQKIKLRMDQVQDLVGGVVEEARQELMGLMMVPMDEHGDVDESRIPTIDVTQLEDDHSDDTVGMSFLDDIRNQWTVDGKSWLMDRVCVEETLQKEWIRSDAADDQLPYRRAAVEAYQRRVDRFLELMLVIMHMVGGQPPRATEILGMRYCNTSNGGFRNIIVHKGQLCYVAAYHKNYRSSERIKVIHRYLPRAVGELLVRYLWLVMPFWQQVQVVVREADEISPFLWDEHFVGRSQDGGEDEGVEAEVADEDEGYCSSKEFDFSTMHRSQKWTSERLRNIIQKCSVEYTGVEMNISAWRHIVIAISRKFLRGDFKGDNVDDIDVDAFDEDDSPWDLQAGHGTHVAGMIYARLLQQDTRGTSSRQEQFRAISRTWHTFLGFEGPVQEDRKRKREVFEVEAQEVQYQRFKRLGQVDIRRKMQMMMGAEAEFRGLQEPAIQAIMQGESPVIQITGTGGGKSLSFMLPAYCVPGGVTVVVAPLVALQEDLHRRCEEMQIDSVMWESSRPSRVASIILVTPEAVVSKTFRTFANRLQRTCKLDRIVFDECHTILDCGPRFRPKMLKLGRALIQMSTQLVFLTATLPPRDVARFFKAMGMPYREGVPVPGMFRAATTRRNIRYAVVESSQESENDVIKRVVHEKLARYNDNSKIIVYSSKIVRAEQLGVLLECPVYHRNVDSRQGKKRRMQAWMSGGQSRVIVATNALGLGVDIPDIRAVIHAGPPRQIRDYAQESGRAGRDGTASEAIIVCNQVPKGHDTWMDVNEIDMPEFMCGRGCRRVIMDRIMDDNKERRGCEEGEEACDVCEEAAKAQEQWSGSAEQWPESADDSGIAMASSSQAEADEPDQQLRERFVQQRSEREWQARQLRVADQEDAIKVSELRRYLEKWSDKCAWCLVCDRSESGEHLLKDCTEHGASIVRSYCEEFTGAVQAKGSLEEFSCCFICYVPQAICQHWVGKSEGGLWEEDSTRCQYIDVIVPAFWSMVVFNGREKAMQWLGEWGAKDGYYNIENSDEEFLKWIGAKVEWGKVEGNRFMELFVEMNRKIG